VKAYRRSVPFDTQGKPARRSSRAWVMLWV
jgi:hypothetical protein